MSTHEQRTAVRAARAAAGAAYASATEALMAAHIELAAFDQVAGTAAMADQPGTRPPSPPRFLGSVRQNEPFIRHEEFAPTHAPHDLVERLIDERAAEISKGL